MTHAMTIPSSLNQSPLAGDLVAIAQRLAQDTQFRAQIARGEFEGLGLPSHQASALQHIQLIVARPLEQLRDSLVSYGWWIDVDP